jgi:hypothetical protein
MVQALVHHRQTTDFWLNPQESAEVPKEGVARWCRLWCTIDRRPTFG